jgi:hypothetical protein
MIGLLFLVINGFSSLARVYCAKDASPGAFSLADGAPAMQGDLRPGRAIGSMRCCSRWCACDSTFQRLGAPIADRSWLLPCMPLLRRPELT